MVPVMLSGELPVTVPWTTRGLARVWVLLTPSVPWSLRVPAPLTDPPLRFKVAPRHLEGARGDLDRTGVVDDQVAGAPKVAVPVEPGLTTRVPGLVKTLVVL